MQFPLEEMYLYGVRSYTLTLTFSANVEYESGALDGDKSRDSDGFAVAGTMTETPLQLQLPEPISSLR